MNRKRFHFVCFLSHAMNNSHHFFSWVNSLFPQEGTKRWHSYQKVGIVMPSDFSESDVNLD